MENEEYIVVQIPKNKIKKVKSRIGTIFRFYCPMVTEKNGNKYKTVPLFGNYAFINDAYLQNERKISDIRIVKINDIIPKITKEKVEQIIQNAKNIFKSKTPHPDVPIQIKDKVKIISGAMTGWEGVVQEIKDNKIIIDVDNVTVVLNKHHVIKDIKSLTIK